MDINEIKKELDAFYKEYKSNKSYLAAKDTAEVVELLTALTFHKDGTASEVARQLSRFSVEISKKYFKDITKEVNIPITRIDEILEELLIADKGTCKIQFYVQKFAHIINTIMNSYKEKSFSSCELPKLISFVAQYNAKSKKVKKFFELLINDTEGKIFLLDYSNLSHYSLENIWEAVKLTFPNLAKSKYKSLIIDWAEKYGFMGEKAEKRIPIGDTPTVQKEDVETRFEHPEDSAPVKTETLPIEMIEKEQTEASDEETVASISTEKKQDIPESAEKTITESTAIETLYNNLKKDLSKEKETIVAAVIALLAPIGKAVDSIQGEVDKSFETGIENAILREKVTNLEHQLEEQETKFQDIYQSVNSQESEKEDLKKQIALFKEENTELNQKLKEAYVINSRESSLEAEKVRSELKKAFAFLYEDWLEYEFSDVSEENYESLQAIIRKTFRSLERNGISFKEDSE